MDKYIHIYVHTHSQILTPVTEDTILHPLNLMWIGFESVKFQHFTPNFFRLCVVILGLSTNKILCTLAILKELKKKEFILIFFKCL